MNDFDDNFATSFDEAASGAPGMAETFTCEGRPFKAIEGPIERSYERSSSVGGRQLKVSGRIYIAWSEWDVAQLAEGKVCARSDGAYSFRIFSTPTLSDPTADVEIRGPANS